MELISENEEDKDIIIDVIATNSMNYAFEKHSDIELHQEFKRILNPEDETNEHSYIHMYYHTLIKIIKNMLLINTFSDGGEIYGRGVICERGIYDRNVS